MKGNLLAKPVIRLALLAFFSLASSFSVQAAVESNFTCNNPEQISNIDTFHENCSLDPEKSFGIASLISIIGEIQSCEALVIDGDVIDGDVIDGDTQNDETIQCETSSETIFTCSLSRSGSVTCLFPDNTAVNCTQEEEGGALSCSITPDTLLTTDLQSTLGSTVSDLPEKEMARVLASICPSRTVHSNLQADCDNLMTLLNSGDPNSLALVADILEEITPTFASISVDAAVTGATAQDQNVQKRLRSLRSQSAARENALANQLNALLNEKHIAGGRSITHQLSGGAAGNTTTPSTEVASTEASANNSFSKLSGFINSTLLNGEKDPTHYERGSDTNAVAFTAGLDYQINDQYVMGLALGLTTTTTDVNAINGKLDVDSYTMTAYGSYYPKDSIYMDYTLSYTGNEYKQVRNITYAGVAQSASTEYQGSLTSLTLGAGYLWNREALTVDSFGQVIHLTADIGEYEEVMSNSSSAGAGWALAIDNQELTSLTLHLGVQANYVFNQSWGVITPLTRIEFISELDDDDRLVTGRFVGDLADRIAFSLKTDEVDTHYFNLGVGVSAVLTGAKSFYAYYQRLIGYDDLNQHQFNIGGRLEF